MAARSIKGFFTVGLIGVGLAFAPMAHADDEDDLPPGAPVIRLNERGVTLAGPSEVRIAKPGSVQGGTVSAGAPILIKNGNPASLPDMPDIKGGNACEGRGNVAKNSTMFNC